ncbi:MAG: DUF6502 family protein [Gammaproteobacteria bacterium]|nr:DUF6502 family protein [Gammaproteobacteria bacterium]MDH5802907.1 DUF6502 family protein [Gammaproteobacteria bacterium]
MSHQGVLFAALRKLLRPLVRLLLQNGIPYKAFVDLIKPIYIEVAAQEIGAKGKKETNSHIATVTGLSRKEVQRVKEAGEVDDIWAFERYNRAARVVTGWVRDERFLDKQKQPRVLSYNKQSPSFVELVAAFSGDVPAKTILDELMEAQVIEKLTNGDIQLIKRVYIPESLEGEKLSILGTDVAGLIATIDHNIYRNGAEAPFFQRKVYYDNLVSSYVPKLKQLIAEDAQALLEKIDLDMAAHDRDANPDLQGGSEAAGEGRSACGIGIFYFENPGSIDPVKD